MHENKKNAQKALWLQLKQQPEEMFVAWNRFTFKRWEQYVLRN